ncbi:hypothetical protein [Infirmifilum sp.]
MTDFCRIRETCEGKAVLRHCDLSEYADASGFVDPAWAPVFYNPRMRCSRDISTSVVAAYAQLTGRSNLTVIDVMSATGVRGIRYALEVEGISRVILNDVNPRAVDLARQNVDLNGLRDVASVENKEAHILLASLRADIVDVDPFGTPAPYVHPAIRALRHKGLLCVTATDLPPLLGKYPAACVRKYFSLSFKSEFSRELAARILLYFIAREAAKLGRRIRPFYTYYLDHHIRVCVIIEKSSKSSFLEENTGLILYNPETLERHKIILRELYGLPGKLAPSGVAVLGGPLWLGSLWGDEAANKVLDHYTSRVTALGLCKKGARLAKRVVEELHHESFYFTTESIASRFQLPHEVSPDDLITRLNSLGYPSSHTHFDDKGFRTRADLKTILDAWSSI